LPVGVIAKLKIQPGKNAGFEATFVKFQQSVRREEPGNIYFGLHRSREDNCAYTVMEQYRDQDALVRHRNMPYYKEIPQTFAGFMAAPAEIEVLDAVE
jgi:quinol monooxygenase YgiN